ncbi:hypothetical protein HDV05_000890 [Chytridiales sp. JEL 0842]|nr:hypothetical protein HDV05_000890 [Chytridiales sp. JEL 0842]
MLAPKSLVSVILIGATVTSTTLATPVPQSTTAFTNLPRIQEIFINVGFGQSCGSTITRQGSMVTYTQSECSINLQCLPSNTSSNLQGQCVGLIPPLVYKQADLCGNLISQDFDRAAPHTAVIHTQICQNGLACSYSRYGLNACVPAYPGSTAAPAQYETETRMAKPGEACGTWFTIVPRYSVVRSQCTAGNVCQLDSEGSLPSGTCVGLGAAASAEVSQDGKCGYKDGEIYYKTCPNGKVCEFADETSLVGTCQ